MKTRRMTLIVVMRMMMEVMMARGAVVDVDIVDGSFLHHSMYQYNPPLMSLMTLMTLLYVFVLCNTLIQQ